MVTVPVCTSDAEEVNGNARISTTSFEGIPSSTSTVVTMNILPTQSTTGSSTLLVDEDGNGTPDITLHANQNSVVTLPPPDLTPPEALFSFSTSTQALLIIGMDASSSSTTALTIATSTTIADASGNTLRIPFLEYKAKNRRIILTFNKLVYNGSTTSIATTTLKYKWNTNKKGEYTMFAAYIKTSSSTIEAHYRPKKNITIVMTRPIDLDDSDDDDDNDNRPMKQKLPRMVIPSIQTQQGNINVNY